jgi:hypothetical protein
MGGNTMDFELSKAQADRFDSDGFLMVDRIVDEDAVDRAVARYEPLFRGEFETGVRPACTSTMCCGSRREHDP